MTHFNPEYKIPEISPELMRGPGWLRDMRESSRESFNDAPLPRRGLHLWRYTDPTQFMFEQAVDSTIVGNSFGKVAEIERQHFDNGRLSGLVTGFAGRDIAVHTGDELTAKGVLVMPLSGAIEQRLDLIEPYLYQLVNSKTGKFEALNSALWNDGIFVWVPDNISIDKPLHLLRQAGSTGSAKYPRLLMVVGENSQFTLIDEYGGGSTDATAGHSYSNGAVEIFGLPGSQTQYVSFQRYASAMHSYLTHRARIGRDAGMITIPLAFGSSVSKQSFGVVMDGPGADSRIFGLAFGSSRQHVDSHTLHHHVACQTQSNIDFKVVLQDRAESAYTGLIRIENDAKTCEAYQENRNLLLNAGARAETIPELEILNEDVSCSHGATVGRIDPEMVFYLNSRGIYGDEAVRMIVSGFVSSTLTLVPADLRERISGFVGNRLEVI